MLYGGIIKYVHIVHIISKILKISPIGFDNHLLKTYGTGDRLSQFSLFMICILQF